MDDLISREAAIDAMYEGMPGLTFNEVLKRLRELPTIDPVRHGKWVKVFDESGEADLMCSVCGERQDGFFGYWNYCTNCGAYMMDEG